MSMYRDEILTAIYSEGGIIMANNQNTQSNQTIEVEIPNLEKSVKTMARCAKINTAITVGLTAAAVVAYAALGIAIKKMANQ